MISVWQVAVLLTLRRSIWENPWCFYEFLVEHFKKDLLGRCHDEMVAVTRCQGHQMYWVGCHLDSNKDGRLVPGISR